MISLLNTLLDFYRLDSGKEQEHPTLFRLRDITDTLFFRQQSNRELGKAVSGFDASAQKVLLTYT